MSMSSRPRRPNAPRRAPDQLAASGAPGASDALAGTRAEQALRLRVMGYNWRQIAQKCGYASHTSAMRAVEKLRESIVTEDARIVAAMQAERLERAILACMEWIEDQPPDQRLWGVDRLVPLLKRQAELLGLDVPPQVLDQGPPRVKVIKRGSDLVHVQELPQAMLPERGGEADA